MQNQSKLILHHVGGRAGSISFPIPENFEQDIINIIYDADKNISKDSFCSINKKINKPYIRAQPKNPCSIDS